jgi:hypothetical protein
MLRVSVSSVSLALLLTACGSERPKAVYEQENFAQNQTYSRSYPADYKVACDAGRRALLSQGYAIDRMSGDTISGHKNFIDLEGRNTQITFNVNCAPDSTGPNQSQVFANAVQDSFSLKKSSTAASVGVGILGSVSLPFSSTDDALVKTSSLTVTRAQFYGGFFDLLQQYLAVSQLEQPEEVKKPRSKPAAPPAPVPAMVTPTVPLTPENTGIVKPAAEPAPAPAAMPAPAPVPAPAPASTPASAPKVEPAAPAPKPEPTPPAPEATPAPAPTAAPASPAASEAAPIKPEQPQPAAQPAAPATESAPAKPADTPAQ